MSKFVGHPKHCMENVTNFATINLKKQLSRSGTNIENISGRKRNHSETFADDTDYDQGGNSKRRNFNSTNQI